MSLPDPFKERGVNIPKKVLSGSVSQAPGRLANNKNFRLAAIIAVLAAVAGIIISLL